MPKKTASKKKTTSKKATVTQAPSKAASKAASKGTSKATKKATAKKSPGKKAPLKLVNSAADKPVAAKKVKASKPKGVQPVPDHYGSVTPTLVVSPCQEALEFYEKAFGAQRLASMPGPDGKLMHAEIKIGNGVIMMADEMPPFPGHPDVTRTPKSVGYCTGGVMLYVADVDALYAQAVEAGATVGSPPQDMFWGDRFAQVIDPYGHVWSMATHLRDVTEAEMQEAMQNMPAPGGD